MTESERYVAKRNAELLALPGWQMVGGIPQVVGYTGQRDLPEDVFTAQERIEELEAELQDAESRLDDLKDEIASRV